MLTLSCAYVSAHRSVVPLVDFAQRSFLRSAVDGGFWDTVELSGQVSGPVAAFDCENV